ncbi:MAG: UDP-2,3-diacylglucosamine diphosphatase LpxI [Candidatus Omnitrophica bacterium]|nr:UDP-2,3-diacylglucosamine diphosphatase LpxI [Candidatus Omnitrophota bacterium]
MSSTIAIIAGAGRFPLYAAEAAKRQGRRVIVIGLKGWVNAPLQACADAYEEVAVGHVGALIQRLKAHGVVQAVLAGKVTKQVLLDGASAFDLEAVALLATAKDRSAPALIGAIGQRLAREGITLLDSSTFLEAFLCPAGVLTKRAPSRQEQRDMELGCAVARALAAFDVGQTVVVKSGVVVAVEALEGTDAAIRRAHALAGEELVVVKTGAPKQDRRLDLPVVGPETLSTLAACGVCSLAMEAGVTLLLDREAVVASADAAQICLVGLALPSA